MKVLALDPGGTTGWAAYDTACPEDGPVWGQIPGGFDGYCEAVKGGLTHSVDTYVIERYTIQERTTKFSRQMDAPEIIGAVKYLAWCESAPLTLQAPVEAKRLVTDEKLRALGWYARGEEHARDATRHLVFFLAQRRLIKLTGGTGGGS